MKLIFRLLLVIFVALSGVLVYIIIRQHQARVDYLPIEVGADSIQAYARRADSLSREADLLEARLDELRLLDRPGAQVRLNRLRNEIAALRTAVERWEVARTPHDRNQAWRECVLLYGRATGVCEALQLEAEESR